MWQTPTWISHRYTYVLYLLQYSWLGNFTYRGAWWITVHGVRKTWTWLSVHACTHTHTHTHTHTPDEFWQEHSAARGNLIGEVNVTELCQSDSWAALLSFQPCDIQGCCPWPFLTASCRAPDQPLPWPAGTMEASLSSLHQIQTPF